MTTYYFTTTYIEMFSSLMKKQLERSATSFTGLLARSIICPHRDYWPGFQIEVNFIYIGFFFFFYWKFMQD